MKVSRQTIKIGSTSEDDLISLKCLFESYKRSCQLSDVTNIRDQLLTCCETDLRRDLHRYFGTGLGGNSEAELLAEIKRIMGLAVLHSTDTFVKGGHEVNLKPCKFFGRMGYGSWRESLFVG